MELPALSRCSLIEMTPRGENIDIESGFESQRSSNNQLTGIKPKALEFFSPMKSPDRNNFTESTKEATASAGRASTMNKQGLELH